MSFSIRIQGLAILLTSAAFAVGGAPLQAAQASRARTSISSLEAEFADPPHAARPYVWWHWMGPNFSLDGISKDLEAMRRAGIGGATIFNLTSAVQESHAPTTNNPWPQQTYRSPAYWDALHHAAAEAERLGLELGLHNTVGYSTTGGPWVDEERSMQRVVWSETEVSGKALQSAGDAGKAAAPGGRLPSERSGSDAPHFRADVSLPRPQIPPFRGWGATGRALSYYRDIAVLAIPAPEPKAPARVLDASAVLDLTDRFEPATGVLRWDPPPGRWTVFRFGHASTGASPHPVPDDLIGRTLEADKMSLVQTQYHWSRVLEPLKNELGLLFGHSLRHVLIDSYEAGPQNWTPGFREEFRRRKGYDPLPWFVALTPTLTGDRAGRAVRVLGSEEQTARFEWDYRDVIATLFRENGWEPAAAAVRAAGLRLQFEAYGGPFDTVAASALADLPMVEFWTAGKPAANPAVVGAARAAGRTIVGAEAFTGRPEKSRWTETPAMLKPFADRMFASGVNRMILHHWVHQPFDDHYMPGMGMGWWGTHFGRYQTWAEPGREFFRYLGRVQALLQRGEPPASIVHVGASVGVEGDVVPMPVFLSGLRVDHGRIVLPSRRQYALVHLPHTGALEPATVRRIEALLEQGATVVARRPERSPSLSGWPRCDEDVRELAAKLWGPSDGEFPSEGRTVGAGRLFADLASAQRALALVPPARIEAGSSGTLLLQLRQEGSTRIVFVCNPEATAARGTLSCAVEGLQPELWNPETGAIGLAPYWQTRDGRTEVALSIGAEKSVFVIFRQKLPKEHRHVTAIEAANECEVGNDDAGRPVLRTTRPSVGAAVSGIAVLTDGKRLPFTLSPAPPQALAGRWTVELAPPVGPRSYLELYALKSLSEHQDPAVRYFSGTAVYTTRANVSPTLLGKGRRVRLDLGEVRDLARVRVNGTDLGVLWHPPFVCDVTDALRLGDNEVEIEVTNTWHNRLVGDEREPADFEWGTDRGPERGRAIRGYPDWFLRGQPRPSKGRVGFSVWVYSRMDTPLLPSGLLGPVRLVPVAERTLEP